jgi:hypothetical protein
MSAADDDEDQQQPTVEVEKTATQKEQANALKRLDEAGGVIVVVDQKPKKADDCLSFGFVCREDGKPTKESKVDTAKMKEVCCDSFLCCPRTRVTSPRSMLEY